MAAQTPASPAIVEGLPAVPVERRESRATTSAGFLAAVLIGLVASALGLGALLVRELRREETVDPIG